MGQRGTKTIVYVMCGWNHSEMCCDGSTGLFKCGKNYYFMRECNKNIQSNGNGCNRAQ